MLQGRLPVPCAQIGQDGKTRVKFFPEPPFRAHRPDRFGMWPGPGKARHRPFRRPDRECDLMQDRHFPDPDLEDDVGIAPDQPVQRRHAPPEPRRHPQPHRRPRERGDRSPGPCRHRLEGGRPRPFPARRRRRQEHRPVLDRPVPITPPDRGRHHPRPRRRMIGPGRQNRIDRRVRHRREPRPRPRSAQLPEPDVRGPRQRPPRKPHLRKGPKPRRSTAKAEKGKTHRLGQYPDSNCQLILTDCAGLEKCLRTTPPEPPRPNRPARTTSPPRLRPQDFAPKTAPPRLRPEDFAGRMRPACPRQPGPPSA